MKTPVFKQNILIFLFMCLISCSDDTYVAEGDVMSPEGFVSFYLTVSSDGLPTGEDEYNENRFSTLDIFFYSENAGDDEAALLHYHRTLAEDVQNLFVKVPSEGLTKPFVEGKRKYKIVAIANCDEVSRLDESETTISRIRALKTGDDMTFRSPAAPESFVMHTLDSPMVVNVDDRGNGVQTYILNFKRLAAKIRLALSVKERVFDDNGIEWRPVVDKMRLFINNGVAVSRLDGDNLSQHADKGDFYSVSPDESVCYARSLAYHDSNYLSGKKDDTYLFYNDIPYYTYPHGWHGESTTERFTSLVVAIPWISESDKEGHETCQTTYYIIPVDNEGKIISDSFYYLRARIETRGSGRFDSPMPTEAECMREEQWNKFENDVILW